MSNGRLTTERALMRDFLRACDDPNLIQTADIGTQSSVDAEDPPVDDLAAARQRQLAREEE